MGNGWLSSVTMPGVFPLRLVAKTVLAAGSAPVNLSDTDNTDPHGELMLAVNDLMTRLQRDLLR